MILMGDEVGHTKLGNNNTYCHDNDLNWFNWELVDQNAEIFNFFQHCIAFRHAHPVLRGREHFTHRDLVGSGYPDISFHSTRAWQTDWSSYVRTLAFMLDGKHAENGTIEDDSIYVAMNMHWEDHPFEIPALPEDRQWHVFVNTSPGVVQIVHAPGSEPVIKDQHYIMVGARSVVILVGKKTSQPRRYKRTNRRTKKD